MDVLCNTVMHREDLYWRDNRRFSKANSVEKFRKVAGPLSDLCDNLARGLWIELHLAAMFAAVKDYFLLHTSAVRTQDLGGCNVHETQGTVVEVTEKPSI